MSRTGFPTRRQGEAYDFFAKYSDRIMVDTNGGCWLWTGTNDGGFGYGKVSRKDRGQRWFIYTHRLSWEAVNGPIPDGMKVLHRCDIPACCNPSHLFLGTQRDNVRDAISKGRHINNLRPPGFEGEQHPDAKISLEQARRIVIALKAGARATEVAAHEKIAKGIVYPIAMGKTWKVLTGGQRIKAPRGRWPSNIDVAAVLSAKGAE